MKRSVCMIWIVVLLAACTSGNPSRSDGTGNATNGGQPPGQEPGEPGCDAAASIVINEVSAANVSTAFDEAGDAEDWIEIHNADTVPVDLGGWALSDDGDEPMKWRFPSFTLEPGGFVLVYASDEDWSRVVASWDTRVGLGHAWRYLEVSGPTDADWFAPTYDDSAWPVGPSGFGSEDGDDETEVDADTVYVRTRIELTADEVADLASMVLHVDYDDAFVAYLDGVEVARAGIGRAGTPPAWDELGTSVHEAELYTGGSPVAFDLQDAVGLLTEGSNTLALEVHQGTADSNDLTLIPFLSLGFGSDRGGAPAAELHLSNAQLHTNFTLKAEGERLRLYDPLGCEADDVDPEQMLADQSYGRQPDGTGAFGYFMEPTPNAPNLTESRPGFAPTPTFDPPPGHYVGGTSVTVDAAGADVHVAYDGWEPTESDALYTAPIDIPADREVKVVRARAYQDGLWPSRIATGTWFTIAPSELAMVSLVTDPPNLWDEATGIYVLGADHEPQAPWFGANFWQDWERPVHMAEWEPDGAMGFAVDAGIAIHGGYTRHHDQKGLLVSLEGGYGDDEIEHEVFPGLGVDAFDRLLLRAAGNDWHGCMSTGCFSGGHLRDPLMHRIAADANVDVLASRPAEVWLNGAYWGVYWLNERPDDSYVASHHGYDDIDLLEFDGLPVEGDEVAWQETLAFLRTHDLSDPAHYATVEAMIDLEELAAYLALEVFYDNTDWPGNNVKYWRPRAPDGRWRWLMYDTDFGLGLYGASPENDSLAAALDPNGATWPNPPWSTEVFRLLVEAPGFRDLFVNVYADYLNTILTPEHMQDTLWAVHDEVAPAMPRQLERWGSWTDGASSLVMGEGKWEDEIWWIDTWMERRPDHARDHVVSSFGLAGTWTLSLDTDPPGAGTFALTAVEVEAPFEGTYFQGVPVTITAVPATGRTFAGWSDATLPQTATITVDATTALDLVAEFD